MGTVGMKLNLVPIWNFLPVATAHSHLKYVYTPSFHLLWTLLGWTLLEWTLLGCVGSRIAVYVVRVRMGNELIQF
jgi:hypothetical protein